MITHVFTDELRGIEFVSGETSSPAGTLVRRLHNNQFGLILEKKQTNRGFFFRIFWAADLEHERNTA